MKIGLVSLGCPKNLVDSEVMLGLAQQAGYTVTPEAADADVLIVNTCAFIESARQESVNAILEMAAHKSDGRCRRLVVTGCLAERYRDELRREIPEIDALLGTGEVPKIVSALERAQSRPEGLLRTKDGQAAVPVPLLRREGQAVTRPSPGRGRTSATPLPESTGLSTASRLRSPDWPGKPRRGPAEAEGRRTAPLPTYIYDDLTPRTFTTPPHFAYVKIGEGCNYKCAFCIIPKLRGPYRSRPADSIVREVRDLAARGVKEILLVSQDTTYFGNDRSERGALASLLRRLNQVDGLEWIRLLYLYPTTITTDTLTAIAECNKVCKYVDLPLQHASDPVLKRMRRPGTRASYVRLIGKIRATIPGVTLRTTFIVGFPGETAREFETLRQFVEQMRFDHVGVFTYSHEAGTPAGRLRDDVPVRVKAQRQRALMTLQKRLVDAAEAPGGRGQPPPDRGAGPRAGGRPVSRTPARPARPAGRPGPGHRSGRLPLGSRPGSVQARHADRRRGDLSPRLRPGGSPVARAENGVIY
jgi:ribosomal protein S12 methylthiotransferase